MGEEHRHQRVCQAASGMAHSGASDASYYQTEIRVSFSPRDKHHARYIQDAGLTVLYPL